MKKTFFILFLAIGLVSFKAIIDNDFTLTGTVKGLENGKTVTIKTENQSEKNIYVSKIMVNGKEVKNHILKHSDIANGGEIIFKMSDKH